MGGTVVDGKEVDGEERLSFLRIGISVPILYYLLEYKPLSGNNDVLEGSITHLVRVNTWVATVFTNFVHRKKRGCRTQNAHTDTFMITVSEAVNQPIERVRRFVEICELAKLALPFEITGSNSKEDRKQKALRLMRRTTRDVCVSSVHRIFHSVENEWFTEYV